MQIEFLWNKKKKKIENRFYPDLWKTRYTYFFIFIPNFLFLIELILIYNIVRVMETY